MNRNILILSLLILSPSLALASSDCCSNLGINFCRDSKSVCYKTASDCECSQVDSTEELIKKDIERSRSEYKKNPDGYRENKIRELVSRVPSLDDSGEAIVSNLVYSILPDIKYRVEDSQPTKCGTIATKQLSINKDIDNLVFREFSQYYKNPNGFRERLIKRLVSRGADKEKATEEVYQILKDFK